MEIGTQEPAITVEPIEDPFRQDEPVPSEAPAMPVEVPVEVPA